MSVVAVIPAKGFSKRLPKKNLLPFGGGTLVSHKVQTLQRCKHVDRIVVGSDSHEILQEAARVGADVIRRDEYHCDESRCSANEMISNLVQLVGGSDHDLVMWCHVTNPLVRAETYDRAIEAYRACEDCDSLASVTAIQRHAWYEGEPLNFAPSSERHQFASELEPISFQDGAIFIQAREQMLANSYFYGQKPLLFPIGEVEGWDVDTREDYLIAGWSLTNGDLAVRSRHGTSHGSVERYPRQD